ncbi:zinc finger BED domain-containing protein 4-like [Cyprinodon tularosa]|uniref:zinc finger BED domain-containing protein 4-like n=2 Tax=Cyprinodon tularosa TaxID=77115 RepID=UPI0018E20EF6|nr:zinc finger BED domain-containing protein 4-like [Cyprinodon tularosa]
MQQGIRPSPQRIKPQISPEAKHVAASLADTSVEASPTGRKKKQPTLHQLTGFKGRVSKTKAEKMTNALAYWAALDCRPIAVVEDKGLSQREDALNHRFLQVATALDPRFKDLKCLPRGERGEVWTSIEALVQQQPGRATPERTEEPARKRSLLLYNSDSESEDEDGPKGALARYKAEPTISERDCPLQWWSTHERAHPQLSVLARKYLGSPATSVPCERLFSLAGNIVQKKRAALSSENVNRLVCLSNWLKERK